MPTITALDRRTGPPRCKSIRHDRGAAPLLMLFRRALNLTLSIHPGRLLRLCCWCVLLTRLSPAGAAWDDCTGRASDQDRACDMRLTHAHHVVPSPDGILHYACRAFILCHRLAVTTIYALAGRQAGHYLHAFQPPTLGGLDRGPALHDDAVTDLQAILCEDATRASAGSGTACADRGHYSRTPCHPSHHGHS